MGNLIFKAVDFIHRSLKCLGCLIEFQWGYFVGYFVVSIVNLCAWKGMLG
jgi:hypothetical protein